MAHRFLAHEELLMKQRALDGQATEALRRCLQQQGMHTVFKSHTTLRSHLVRSKYSVDPTTQKGVVYKIPCECHHRHHHHHHHHHIVSSCQGAHKASHI